MLPDDARGFDQSGGWPPPGRGLRRVWKSLPLSSPSFVEDEGASCLQPRFLQLNLGMGHYTGVIDSHAHIDFDHYSDDRDDMMARMARAGVKAM